MVVFLHSRLTRGRVSDGLYVFLGFLASPASFASYVFRIVRCDPKRKYLPKR